MPGSRDIEREKHFAAFQADKDAKRRKEIEQYMSKTLQSAAACTMSEIEKMEQRISFVFGNVSMHNPNITREIVREAAEELDREKE